MLDQSRAIYIQAMVAAAQARIAGMQALNQHRLSLGQSIAYDEDAFFEEATGLEQLAIDALNS